jgi:protein-tyrosine phosphatase
MSATSSISASNPGAVSLPRIGRWLGNLLVGCFALVTLPVLLCVGLIEGNLVHGHYPQVLRNLAWALGEHEHVYNFGSVIPGKVFRSGQPDERFINYVVRNYGIRHIITLNGRTPLTKQKASQLGITTETYHWNKKTLPTQDEFQEIARALDDKLPVLVHCHSGMDRTGYLVAAYRMLELGWPEHKALTEMRKYGHRADRYPEALEYFRKMVAL